MSVSAPDSRRSSHCPRERAAGATEDGHRHAQLILLVICILDAAMEVRERPFLDANDLADLEQHLRARLLHTLLHLLHDLLNLLVGDRSGLVRSTADKAGHLGRGLHQVPGLVVHFHLDEHVAREELALGDGLLTATHLDHLFDRNQDLAEAVLHPGTVDAIDQRALNGLLEARIGVNHIPTLAHITSNPERGRTGPIPGSCPSARGRAP